MDEQEQSAYLSSYRNSISKILPSFSFSLPLTFTTFLTKLPNLPKLDLTSSQSTNTNGARMTSEEYENLLNYINAYIQKQLDEKSSKIDIKVNKEISLIISEKLKEQNFATAATNQNINIDEIVEAVYLRLQSSPLKFHSENIIEIQKLVKDITKTPSNDIDGIVMRILNAPQLSQFIDNRIFVTGDSENHNSAIAGLTGEIELIKRILDEKIHENQELRELLDKVRVGQEELSRKVDVNEAFTKDELAKMLILIDEKLSNLNEQQFEAINVQIKKSLGEIFGYKKDVEQLDLENWIKSLFVAKELLEEGSLSCLRTLILRSRKK
uniref:Uncharacterized protein n=1 Tax=Megaselia scalaris TaxID=36166 RepID=T1GCZ4_MEGSC